MAELTPFPDGIGYLENAWVSLSPVQKDVLLYKAGQGGRPANARARSYLVLVRHMLLDSEWEITDRGQAVADWSLAMARGDR